MIPVRHASDDPALGPILDLIQKSFAYMDRRIDPPSSMHRLDLERLSSHCEDGEVWSIGTPPIACMILSDNADALYLRKLAVAVEMRGQGLARRLVGLALERARVRGKLHLELKVRIELVENQLAFEALGFTRVRSEAHAGFDRPTSIVMRRSV